MQHWVDHKVRGEFSTHKKFIVLSSEWGKLVDARSIVEIGGTSDMKRTYGFAELLKSRSQLPQTGWIFVDKHLYADCMDTLRNAIFYIAENEDDDFDGEENLSTLVEARILQDVHVLRDQNRSNPSEEDYLRGLLHYLRNDDFLD